MKLMVLDGNSIVNRAFYGIRLLSNREGLYTNAVYGFLMILSKLLDQERPDALCAAFDLAAPTFRHQEYEEYKAGRKPMPDELAVQIPVLKQVLDAMNIPRYELEGYEADDLIGTIGRKCEAGGWDCQIVTGDRDSLQLITGRVHVKLVSTRMGKTEEKEYDTARFEEEYGFEPAKIVDLKALMGDASDHIPGVPGVGEKTALDLLRRFGSLEAIYAGLPALDIKAGVRKKLEEGKDSAFQSYRLATIDTDAPIAFAPEDALRREMNRKEVYELFLRLEFSRLIEKFGLAGGEGGEAAPARHEALPAEVLRSEEEISDLLARCRAAERVAVVCPRSLDAVAVSDGQRVFLAFRADLPGAYEGFLRELFGPEVKKAAHEVKEMTRLLLEEGLPAEGFVFDTALAAYLIDSTGTGYGLEKLAMKYLSMELPERKAFEDETAYSPLGDRSGAEAALAAWADCVGALCAPLSDRLEELGMDELFRTVELPLCRVLAEMERTGFLVDPRQLREFGDTLFRRIDELQTEIYRQAGGKFNINSTKQLGTVLFENLGLPALHKTKTGYSTNIEVLEKLRGQHPIIESIMEYRQLTKLKSTYADGLLKVIGPDGRIHTSFQMTVTATGRLSSTEPNLQNIPVRTELGSEIRKMFIPAEGKLLVDADYSQIELRLLAHISGDPVMCRAFREGEDIHQVTASQVFGVPPEQVTHLMRSRAKAVNFGIVYGISDFSLAQDIGVTRYEARQYMDQYLEKYAGVREYMKNIVEKAKENGYVVTLMNRRRWLPELKSKDHNVRSFGERVALNTPIQGTAADIIKLAMIRVRDRLNREGLRARLVLQVHDELIVEAPREEAEQVKKLLAEEMEGVMALSVPLVAGAASGNNWYEAKA